MVLRPKNREPEPAAPDVEFVEELVRKSLEINKNLRSGESTTRYLKKLREQAKGGSRAAAAAETGSKAPKPRSQLERKTGTLGTFLESKAVDFDGQHAKIRERRAQIDSDEEALRTRFVDDLVDMLTIIADGEDIAAFRAVLTHHKTFLAQLGVRDVDVLKAVKRRG